MSARACFVIGCVLALIIGVGSCSKPVAPSKEIVHGVAPALVASVAASTLEAIEQLSAQFQRDTGIEVKINAGPSNALAAQILAGAPVDVFLSASPEWADKLEAEGRAAAKVELLTNRLVAVVPRGNPAGVHGPKDLATASVTKLALAGENVPAGKYADQALAKLGLLDQLNSAGKIARAEDVRAAISFVERGEAEAGLVYATDARLVPDVDVAFEFDPALHDPITYVLVLVKNESANPMARRYYDFLRSPPAMAVYEKFGFTPLGTSAAAARPN